MSKEEVNRAFKMLHSFCDKLLGVRAEKQELFQTLATYEEAYLHWFRISPILSQGLKIPPENSTFTLDLVSQRDSSEYAFKKCLEDYQRSHGLA